MKAVRLNLAKKAIAAAALAAVLTAPAIVQAAGNVPPKPDYCKSARCIIGCMVPAPFSPFGGMSSDTRFCNRWGLPLQWFVRGK